jgi:hypothetical protein
MKKTVTIIILVLAFIGGFLIFYKDRSPSDQQNKVTSVSTSQKWETKTDDQASVTVVVTPLDLLFQSKEWKFDIGMNTHSVELDQDMTKVAVLVDDQGKEYQAVSWQGPEGGGHHREGVLAFNPITPYPQHLTLKVKDVGAVERTFSWTLNE